MIPWNNQQDNIIDRFDGRALLDFYREPSTSRRQEKTPEEVELDEVILCGANKRCLQSSTHSTNTIVSSICFRIYGLNSAAFVG